MEVRVTPHSSLSSWDGRGARQTKAKADGGGDKMKKRARERERERSCQLPTDRGGNSEKGDITQGGRKKGKKKWP